MHGRCVKYCVSRSPLPEQLPQVAPWEEEEDNMGPAKRRSYTKKPGWDPNKVDGTTSSPLKSLAELTDENLPGLVFDPKPLPVLGMQDHGRQLQRRGL